MIGDWELIFSELSSKLMPEAYTYMEQMYRGAEMDDIDLDVQAKLYVYDSIRRWASLRHKESTKGLLELTPETCDCGTEDSEGRHFIGCAIWRAA